MQLRKYVLIAAAMVTVPIAITSSALASSFSSLVVYGDSLSDNGNLYSLIGYPPPPYYQGRFSNGPVAAEQLATGLGVPLYDFAVGGATSGVGNYVDGGTQTSLGAFGLPGMKAELAESAPLLASPLTPSSLFLVWGGANDFLTGGSPTVAAANVDGIVAALESDGAQHILVPGLPNLGLTPDYAGDPAATAYTNAFNTALVAGLPMGAIYFNTSDLLNQVEADPAAFGLTNTTAPCFNGTTVCADPNQYLFWDGFHPTTAVDTIVADDFLKAAETPEPSSLLLLGTGLGLPVLLIMGRHRIAYSTQRPVTG
jgi:phospholipase/lecithinase/hemolysin